MAKKSGGQKPAAKKGAAKAKPGAGTPKKSTPVNKPGFVKKKPDLNLGANRQSRIA